MTARVLQVVLNLAPGGTERLVIELSRRLRGEYGMNVCCLDETGEWAEELVSDGISVTALGRRPGFSPDIGRQIAMVARKQGATILHCHHYSPFVYGMIARLWHPANVIFTEHGRTHDGPPSRKRSLANQVFGRLPSRIYAVSKDLRRHMVDEGFSADRVDVVYNGIEVGHVPTVNDRRDARAALGLSPSEVVIGAVGRLDPVKDLVTVLSAFRLTAARFPKSRLVLIGDGPERANVTALVERHSLGGRVMLAGYRRDVRELLPALDVYVNTSIFEGVSLTILEAMAAAIPVVATRVGGTPEVVVDRQSGVLVPARDPNAVSSALETLLQDAALRYTYGRAARERVASTFSVQRMVAQYAAAYAELGRNTCVA